MPDSVNFDNYTVVACGVLRPEIDFLKQDGFLNTDKILYTAPGLHENVTELQKQLKAQINSAKKHSARILTFYGKKCYIDYMDFSRDIDALISETNTGAGRIEANNCVDMLVGRDKREEISSNKKIYWLTPGWLKYWKVIFKDWDRGKANETFPQYDKAVILDALGIFERYSEDSPEKILEFSDWMGVSIDAYRISLDRFKNKIRSALNNLQVIEKA